VPDGTIGRQYSIQMKAPNISNALVTAIAALSLLTACISPGGSDAARRNAIDAKAQVLTLMDKATESSAAHEQEIQKVNGDLESAYQLEVARAGNKTSVAMWDSLIHTKADNPKSGIYPRFVAEWKAKDKLGATYIGFKKQNVSEAFDKIISLEGARSR
jgi:hypothetical protein